MLTMTPQFGRASIQPSQIWFLNTPTQLSLAIHVALGIYVFATGTASVAWWTVQWMVGREQGEYCPLCCVQKGVDTAALGAESEVTPSVARDRPGHIIDRSRAIRSCAHEIVSTFPGAHRLVQLPLLLAGGMKDGSW